MSEYLQIPKLLPKERFHGVEAVSPYARIHPRQSRQEGDQQPSSDSEKNQPTRNERRFTALRQLIEVLAESAQIIKLDYATAEAELRQLGLERIEENLISQLLSLKIPLQEIEQLQLQLAAEQASISLGRGRLMENDSSGLFPISAAGLSEYILKIDDLQLRRIFLPPDIARLIEQEGFYAVQAQRLRLTFSPHQRVRQKPEKRLSLRITTLLGVIENEEEGRRAILFPRSDGTYGLYADKMINLSI